MTICAPCLTGKPVPVCVENLTLGTIPLLNTAVYIYFHSIQNGKFFRTTGLTNGAGLLIADLTQIKAMSNHMYEVWVTDQAAVNIEERQAITIGGSSTECLNVEFDRVTGEANYTLAL